MDQQTEEKLLSTLYDRLYDIATHVPEVAGQPVAPEFARARTMIHLSKNQVVKVDQFANALSPSNPAGSPAEAEAFSAMVDSIPLAQTEYKPRPGTVSSAYKAIVTGANSTIVPTAEQQARYDEADQLLNSFKEVQVGGGQTRKVPVPTDLFKDYKTLRAAFNAAVSARAQARNQLDLTIVADQQKWQAIAPVLDGNIQDAYDSWRNAGAQLVEEALATKSSSINNAIRLTIQSDQAKVALTLPSILMGGSPWNLSYALVDAWSTDAVANSFGEFSLSSAKLNTTSSSEYTSYGASGGWGFGLWSVGGGFNSSTASTHSHMDSNKFELKCKVGMIQIARPWFDEVLFNLTGWDMTGVAEGGISTGSPVGANDCLLPLVPMAFIVARDVEITIDNNSSDRTFLESQFSSSISVGWGPFSLSGNYSHRDTQETFKSSFDGATLKVPGVQIIGWVSAVLPRSPK